MKFLLSFSFLLATLQSGFAAPPKPTAPAVGRLHAGWAMTSITPDVPVALAGQFQLFKQQGIAPEQIAILHFV